MYSKLILSFLNPFKLFSNLLIDLKQFARDCNLKQIKIKANYHSSIFFFRILKRYQFV